MKCWRSCCRAARMQAQAHARSALTAHALAELPGACPARLGRSATCCAPPRCRCLTTHIAASCGGGDACAPSCKGAHLGPASVLCGCKGDACLAGTTYGIKCGPNPNHTLSWEPGVATWSARRSSAAGSATSAATARLLRLCAISSSSRRPAAFCAACARSSKRCLRMWDTRVLARESKRHARMRSSDRSSYAFCARSCSRWLTRRAACSPNADRRARMSARHENLYHRRPSINMRALSASRLAASGAPGSPAARRGRARGRRGRRGRRPGPERLVGRQEGLHRVRDGRRHQAVPHLRGPRALLSGPQRPAHHRRLLGPMHRRLLHASCARRW